MARHWSTVLSASWMALRSSPRDEPITRDGIHGSSTTPPLSSVSLERSMASTSGNSGNCVGGVDSDVLLSGRSALLTSVVWRFPRYRAVCSVCDIRSGALADNLDRRVWQLLAVVSARRRRCDRVTTGIVFGGPRRPDYGFEVCIYNSLEEGGQRQWKLPTLVFLNLY